MPSSSWLTYAWIVMPFLSPFANFRGMLLDDRAEFPWISLDPLEYESELTGKTYIVPRNFRTDGSSVPKALMLLSPLAMRYFGGGVWQGFKQGVLHDYLLRYKIEPNHLCHKIFREALYEGNYPVSLVETYYAAVKAANP